MEVNFALGIYQIQELTPGSRIADAANNNTRITLCVDSVDQRPAALGSLGDVDSKRSV